MRNISGLSLSETRVSWPQEWEVEVCLCDWVDVDARNHVVDGLRVRDGDSVEDGALEALENDSHDSREGEEDEEEHAAHIEQAVDFALSLLIARGLAESLPFLRL